MLMLNRLQMSHVPSHMFNVTPLRVRDFVRSALQEPGCSCFGIIFLFEYIMTVHVFGTRSISLFRVPYDCRLHLAHGQLPASVLLAARNKYHYVREQQDTSSVTREGLVLVLSVDAAVVILV